MNEINLISNDRRYEIKARMMTFISENTITGNKKFSGVRWTVKMYRKGEEVSNINGVHFGKAEEGTNVCSHHLKLTQNTILYAAFKTGYFSRSLKDFNSEKIQREWQKQHEAAKRREMAELAEKKNRKLRLAI